jgi:hypothetical protein
LKSCSATAEADCPMVLQGRLVIPLGSVAAGRSTFGRSLVTVNEMLQIHADDVIWENKPGTLFSFFERLA